MARYFFGNTLAAIIRSDSTVVEVTTAGKFDSTYVANALILNSTGGTGAPFIDTMPFLDAASATTLWTHVEVQVAGTSNLFPLIRWYNSSGVLVAQIIGTNSSTFQFQYWNGSSFTTLGTTFSLSFTVVQRLDIKLTAGVSGTVDVYLGGSNILSASGMNAAVTNFAKVRFASPGSGTTAYVSQLLGADFDTRDSRYLQKLASGEGGVTNGSGAYTDINEAVLDESTAIVLPAIGNRHTFTKSSITVPSGYAISALCQAGRARVSGGTVTDGKFVVRQSSTNYSSAGKAFNTGYEPRGDYRDNDPATAAAWTQAGFNSAEFGLEAA